VSLAWSFVKSAAVTPGVIYAIALGTHATSPETVHGSEIRVKSSALTKGSSLLRIVSASSALQSSTGVRTASLTYNAISLSILIVITTRPAQSVILG
jgi:hypothetical protein